MSSPVLEKKAAQAQVIYEDLIRRFEIDSIPTTFVADDRREAAARSVSGFCGQIRRAGHAL